MSHIKAPPQDWDVRTKLLIGEDNYKTIQTTRFLLIGNHPSLSFVSEYLIRAGSLNLRMYYPEMNKDDSVSLHAFNNGENEITQLKALNPTACIELCEKPYDQILLRGFAADRDVVIVACGDIQSDVMAISVCAELKKKVFAIIGGNG
ncbi:hypothetical protein EIN_253150, partial [Entamoeba invadens IP1]